jgi:hypothetical protein
MLLPFSVAGLCLAEPVRHLEPETLDNVLYVRSGDTAGTAFLLKYGGNRYLVTARHVVASHLEEPPAPVEFLVGGRNGRLVRKVKLLHEDRRSDLAIFAFEEDPRVPYFAADAGLVPHGDLHLASQVFLVGYPASLHQTYGLTQLRVVGGWIAGLKKYVPGSTVEYVDVDMPGVEHGHSGGPILLLQDRVVAVAVQRRTGSVSDTIGATYAVPIKYVTSLIDDTPVPEDVNALNETLRGTVLVCGVAAQGKNDCDLWSQRVRRDTGEGVWGDLGIFVASSPSRECSAQVVPSDDGAVLVVHSVVFPDGEDHDVFVQKVSRYGELLFDAGVRSLPVGTTELKEGAPLAVSDGADGAIVVFEIKLANGDVDILGQRIAPDGRRLWADTGVAVATGKQNESRPAITTDGAGGALVAFEIALEDGDVDVFAQRIRADGSLAWHEGKRSAVVATARLPERRPRIVSDGEGGAIVVYEAGPIDDGVMLLAQRVSPHGELLWNEGNAGTLISALPLTGDDRGLTVIPDGLGGAFIAFEIVPDAENPADVDIAVQHLSGDGRLLWGGGDEGELPAPVLAASSKWPERYPVLHGDGQGGVIVACESGSSQGDADIRAQRVGVDGKLKWHEGKRTAEVAYTFLPEHAPRIVERHRDRVLVAFEVVQVLREGESVRRVIACQSLSIETGEAIYGRGRFPVSIVDPPDGMQISYHLRDVKTSE